MTNDEAVFVALVKVAESIMNCSMPMVGWAEKYDLIFSPAVSGQIEETIIPFEWTDTDSSYQDDVECYVSALNQKVLEIEARHDKR